MENIDYNDTRSPEFQAVIIVDYDDGRLFPLTNNTPCCLLPIANRKLLAYQLDMLAKSGIVGMNFVLFPVTIFS
jgi:translation initiation factor eIF-2B subunit epsilon